VLRWPDITSTPATMDPFTAWERTITLLFHTHRETTPPSGAGLTRSMLPFSGHCGRS
jgi:hypothetical protein